MKICPACAREYRDEHEACPEDGAALVHLDTGAGERPEDLLGQVIDGRYRIERIVGRGGMGTVYACRHVIVGKAFAMKVLRPGIERSEEVLQRFIREAQAANAIPSRHICQMTDFGQLRALGGKGGAFYVVMELLDGMSLTRALREGLDDRSVLEHIFIQIAETLEKAHAAGIVHRDLKPDNVMLIEDEGEPWFVKLVDFGIAKAMRSKAGDLTETGVILGTPFYMSPEQARGEALDGRSDIYALGVMMYRAFTGKLPFVADTAMGVLTRHLTDKPEPPSRIREIDGALERLILRCLEKKPIDRFQRMADVAEAIASLRDGVGSTSLERTLDERSAKERRRDRDPRATRVDTPRARARGPVPPADDSVTAIRAPHIPPAMPHPLEPSADSPAVDFTSDGHLADDAFDSVTAPEAPPPFALTPSYPPPSHPPPDGAYPGETNRGLVASHYATLAPPAHGRRVALIGGAAAIFVTIGAVAAIAVVEPERPLPSRGEPAVRSASDAPLDVGDEARPEGESDPGALPEDEAIPEVDDATAETSGDEASKRDEKASRPSAKKQPTKKPHQPTPPEPSASAVPSSTPSEPPPPAIDDGVRSPFEDD